jgi:WhiB family redox-sensing transcriptional regulator
MIPKLARVTRLPHGERAGVEHSGRVKALAGGVPMPQVPEERDWTIEAACNGEDRELFFGPDDLRTEPTEAQEVRVREAKGICARCTVRQECLDFALSVEAKSTRLRYGIFGGLTAGERNRGETFKAPEHPSVVKAEPRLKLVKP